MAVYTISPCIMRDSEPNDFLCYSNLLFTFTHGPHKVAIDKDGSIIDIYSRIEQHKDIIQTWLQLMSNTPRRFEKIPVNILDITDEFGKFLVLCKATKGQHKIIVNSIQNLDCEVDDDNCVDVDGVKVKILDRMEAEQEINIYSISDNDFLQIKRLINEEPFEWNKIEEKQENLFLFVQKICYLFKSRVENNRMYGLLYNQDGSFKNENAIQELFQAIASCYCEMFGIDINREGDSGIGEMDFKFSYGSNHKVILEIKLANNSQLFHGYEVQLPAYLSAENSSNGIYMVVKTEKEDDERCMKLQQYVSEKKGVSQSSELIVVDARKRPSASKL